MIKVVDRPDRQHTQPAGHVREQPFSLFIELNVLLYSGVLAFVAGLSWTVATWSRHLGDVLVVALLSAIVAACLWYCFARAPMWSPLETTPAGTPPSKTQTPTSLLDYVLYLGCLVWCIELAYLEQRFHVLSKLSPGHWDVYLLATAVVFFCFAYRFDNRFVLSLALSSLAGWFGFTISHWPSNRGATYREYALLYCLLVASCGVFLQYRGLKRHFFGTYLNVVANVLFCALLSGVFQREGYGWFLALLLACGASLAWGLMRRQFAFVVYAAVYGYLGVSSLVLRSLNEVGAILGYFVLSAFVMLLLLIQAARRSGRPV